MLPEEMTTSPESMLFWFSQTMPLLRTPEMAKLVSRELLARTPWTAFHEFSNRTLEIDDHVFSPTIQPGAPGAAERLIMSPAVCVSAGAVIVKSWMLTGSGVRAVMPFWVVLPNTSLVLA